MNINRVDITNKEDKMSIETMAQTNRIMMTPIKDRHMIAEISNQNH